MIHLSASKLLGSGSERDCYLHPKNPNLCIKVHARDGHGWQHARQQIRDAFYYQFLSATRKPWRFIAEYHGSVNTNLGTGLVFTVPRDTDGKVSKDLSFYLQHQLIDKKDLKHMLKEFKEYLKKHGVLAYDIDTDNVLVVRKASGNKKLVLVDGLGKRNFLRLCAPFKFYARKHLKKSWRKFIHHINNDLRAHGVDQNFPLRQ